MKCEICKAEESKYKCPTCGIRYCSLKCYKNEELHNHTKINDTKRQDEIQEIKKATEAGPEVKAIGSGTCNTNTELSTPKLNNIFQNSPQLKQLLKYNTVKFHLTKVYKILNSDVGGQGGYTSKDMQRQLAIDYLNTLRYGGVHQNEAIEEFCQIFLEKLEAS
ncbi:HIT domain protein [Maudiozyma exigua]|uniref:HIT domain protein n=1 Tax=Maudiozyma exigua TaxID=34358 RepID=A0A9P6VT12_MAUEX|nr:HIT domain protein [Kazachstania exigua]